ncbi:sacsin like HSP90 chaperone domain [Cryptosporidium ryanae]|uniref:sacsin like HSP90 chaperone domain n=1 Tax=Cryptosporidium ryanae TaxID=515981 RepID=UPI003519F9DD|nr:sacsin like HSP90 chaperone domain [Cryptosporidium ryanae]
MKSEEAKEHINEIRRNLFLSNELQRERQDRFICILTNELYSSFGRVLFEILQNADDSNFIENDNSDFKNNPRIYILLRWDCLVVHINEVGMTAKNIESVCDIGNSSKKNSESRCFTGEKGIGYMSFFKITNKPGIYSSAYSIRFSSEPDEEIGLSYIVPKWEEEEDFPDVVKTIHNNVLEYGVPWIEKKTSVSDCCFSKGTVHFLPFGNDKKRVFPALLSAIHETFVPDLLLFLRNIKSIVIDVEPRRNSGFCSSDKNVIFPLLRRTLFANVLKLIPRISELVNLSPDKSGIEVDPFSDIKGFEIVNLEVRQFDEDDLDSTKSELLREGSVSSCFMIINWSINAPTESASFIEDSSVIRDRVSRRSTNWSIALPLYHTNNKRDVTLEETSTSSSNNATFSLGSSVFGKQKRINGKLFCTFPLDNKLHIPFHVNIQDLILTANRENYIVDNEWNKYILKVVFENQITDLIASLINNNYLYSRVIRAINQEYSLFTTNVLLEKSLNCDKIGSELSSYDCCELNASDLIKFSWIPEKSNEYDSPLSIKCASELLNRPFICKIDGSFCKYDQVYLNIRTPELCVKAKSNNDNHCLICKLHIELLKQMNFVLPVLHPVLVCGHTCMQFADTKAVQLLRLVISQSILSYNIKYISIFRVLSSNKVNDLLNRISDDTVFLLVYYYLNNEKEEKDWFCNFENFCYNLKIIPTVKGGRVTINDLRAKKVFIPEESFTEYWKANNYDDCREIIDNICQMDFFNERIYNLSDFKMRDFIESVFKIEVITKSSFYKWIIEEIDQLIEKVWEYAVNKDIQRILLKITPLIIEDKSLVDSDFRALMKLPIVVQTYSPSFLKALMYNKDPPKSYASEEELLNKDKLARCSFMNNRKICGDCGSKLQLQENKSEVRNMVQPTSVSLRMSQVSKSLTSLLTLHSNWERSKKNAFKKNATNKSKHGDNTGVDENNNTNQNFEYKGLTIVPPLWPPVVEWVFSRVCDRFNFVEISSDYIVQNPSTGSESDLNDQYFRSFMNKFINLLEQWYVGCNFDRLPPKTDSVSLSWMVDNNTYPLSSSSCFYCKHLIYLMRAGALIQVANEYSRRSYSSYFLDSVLPEYSWIPISLNSRDYYCADKGKDAKSGEKIKDPLLSKPNELIVPDIELEGIPKYISRTMLNSLPVTLRNAYKVQLPHKVNEESRISNRFTYKRIEEDEGDELRRVIETLENLGVTTQISTASLIKILKSIKREFESGGESIDRIKCCSSTGLFFPVESEMDHLTELASFGFGVTRDKLLQSEWWKALYKEWMDISEEEVIRQSNKNNNANKSLIDTLCDIYQLIGQQSDFDISLDLKKAFYKDSLLYIPLMKSTIYNWVNVDYNTMVWSDPYDFFRGTFMVFSKFIKKERVKGLMPFFLSLVSEQPIHQHYAYLWLKECPSLLEDESKEGRIKFESFISVSINKFVDIYCKFNLRKKSLWWKRLCEHGKVPIKGRLRFYNRDNCCLEDIYIRNYKHDQFTIPLALTPNTNSYFFYKEIFKVKTLSECYNIKHRTRCFSNNKKAISKLGNKLWLTLEFWGTFILLLKYKSLDVYLSILTILNDKKSASNSKEEMHDENLCEYCISEDEMVSNLLLNSSYVPFEPVKYSFISGNNINSSYDEVSSYSDTGNANGIDEGNMRIAMPNRNCYRVGEVSMLLADWLVIFMNTFEVEVSNIELEFELREREKELNLPKRSMTTTGVLFKRIQDKKSSMLFINKNMDKRDQLVDLYKLLIEPIKESFEISRVIGIDLYELLILSTQQRVMLLLKHFTIFSSNSSVSKEDQDNEENIRSETIVKVGLEFLELCSSKNCITKKETETNRQEFSVDIPSSGKALFLSRTEMTKNNVTLDDLIKGYVKPNPISLVSDNIDENDNLLSIEEANLKIGTWGEKVSFEEILPNIISRTFTLKSIEFELIEDYLSKYLILSNNFEKDDYNMDLNNDNGDILKDLISIQNMRIDDDNKNINKTEKLIKCRIKLFKETDETVIKLVWLNSIDESYLPFDFIITREYINQGVKISQNKAVILALIEVKTTKLPIWRFNISGNEIQASTRTGNNKFKLLLIKDAGTEESQWLLVDQVDDFIKSNCKLINGLFEVDFHSNKEGKFYLSEGSI